MDEKNKSLKKAHVLLGIPAIFTCILLFFVLAYNIHVFCEARQDSLSGGWIIFYQMILGIIGLPLLAIPVAQCITFIVSFLKRKKSPKSSRGAGNCKFDTWYYYYGYFSAGYFNFCNVGHSDGTCATCFIFGIFKHYFFDYCSGILHKSKISVADLLDIAAKICFN